MVKNLAGPTSKHLNMSFAMSETETSGMVTLTQQANMVYVHLYRSTGQEAICTILYPLNNLLYFHILAMQEWLWLYKHIEQKPFVRLAKTWMNNHHLWRERHVHRSIHVSLGTPLTSTRTLLLQSDGKYDSFRESVLSNSSFKWIECSCSLRHDVTILQCSVFSSETGQLYLKKLSVTLSVCCWFENRFSPIRWRIRLCEPAQQNHWKIRLQRTTRSHIRHL